MNANRMNFLAKTFKAGLLSGLLMLAAANTALAKENFVDVQVKATPWSKGWSVGVLNFTRIFGDEDYSEVFFTPTISWNYFPWDNVVDTTAAIGVGLSYTSIESNLDNSGKNLLASMIFELEFKLPEYEKVSMFTRIHHRSTAGIFAEGGGSNFYAIGLRYNFN